MNTAYHQIGNAELLLSIILMAVVFILNRIEKIRQGKDILLGTVRCFIQLMAVGYVLKAVFSADKWYLVILILSVMILVAGTEAVRREKKKIPGTYVIVTGAIAVSSMAVIAFALLLIVRVKPWYNPQYVVPMMGMLVGNSMNGASLLVNRLRSEIASNREVIEAKLSLGADAGTAAEKSIVESIRAAMIPTINSLMVIGLVSLPGMMTGQIIAGASPLDSVRYQIAIMYMITASNALTIYITALFTYRQFFTPSCRLKDELL